MPEIDLKSLSQAERLLDMAAYLSRVRSASAKDLSERYGVSIATVFRDKNALYDILGIFFVNSRGQHIEVAEEWHFKYIPLLVEQRRAVIRAIEETDDETQKKLLRSIL